MAARWRQHACRRRVARGNRFADAWAPDSVLASPGNNDVGAGFHRLARLQHGLHLADQPRAGSAYDRGERTRVATKSVFVFAQSGLTQPQHAARKDGAPRQEPMHDQTGVVCWSLIILV
jgi:hypothetical protein